MPVRSLTDEEVVKLIDALKNPRDRCLFILGYRTGFRISELLSLKPADVIGDTLTVWRRNMKGKRESRTVPIHSSARAEVAYYIGTGIPKESKLFDISRQHAWRVIKEAARRAGIPGRVATHSMRKTFGMKVYHYTGKDLVAAQRALGHKDIGSTGHYLSIGDDEIEEAILNG